VKAKLRELNPAFAELVGAYFGKLDDLAFTAILKILPNVVLDTGFAT
jgi:hypothetical protein